MVFSRKMAEAPFMKLLIISQINIDIFIYFSFNIDDFCNLDHPCMYVLVIK